MGQLEGLIEEAIHAWSGEVKWFPQDPDAQVDIADRILVWVSGDAEKVKWLRAAVLGEMREWSSIGALRQLFVTRYRLPAGVEQWRAESGTYYLDGPGDAERRLAATNPKPLPAPEESFEEALLREASEAMERSRESVPDLKHGGGQKKGAAA